MLLLRMSVRGGSDNTTLGLSAICVWGCCGSVADQRRPNPRGRSHRTATPAALVVRALEDGRQRGLVVVVVAAPRSPAAAACSCRRSGSESPADAVKRACTTACPGEGGPEAPCIGGAGVGSRAATDPTQGAAQGVSRLQNRTWGRRWAEKNS